MIEQRGTVVDATKPKPSGSLKDYVYQRIVEDICSGELAPDTIFTERRMIERYGVSKAPVREALVQLCHEKALRSIPRSGYQVIQVSAQSIREFTELRLILELNSLPAVLENLTEQTISMFKEMNGRRLENPEGRTLWTAWNNNISFHLQLNKCARNAQVTGALERALSTCTRAYAQVYKEQQQIIAPPSKEIWHDKIISALERSELYTAQGCLKQDILMMEQTLLANPNAQGHR